MRHRVVQLTGQQHPLLRLRLLEPPLAGAVLVRAAPPAPSSSAARPAPPIASETPVQWTRRPSVAGTKMIADPPLPPPVRSPSGKARTEAAGSRSATTCRQVGRRRPAARCRPRPRCRRRWRPSPADGYAATAAWRATRRRAAVDSTRQQVVAEEALEQRPTDHRPRAAPSRAHWHRRGRHRPGLSSRTQRVAHRPSLGNATAARPAERPIPPRPMDRHQSGLWPDVEPHLAARRWRQPDRPVKAPIEAATCRSCSSTWAGSPHGGPGC